MASRASQLAQQLGLTSSAGSSAGPAAPQPPPPAQPETKAQKHRKRKDLVAASLSTGERHFGEDHDASIAAKGIADLTSRGHGAPRAEMGRVLATPWPISEQAMGQAWKTLVTELAQMGVRGTLAPSKSCSTGWQLSLQGGWEDVQTVEDAFWSVVDCAQKAMGDDEDLDMISIPPMWARRMNESFSWLEQEVGTDPAPLKFDRARSHARRTDRLRENTFLPEPRTALHEDPALCKLVEHAVVAEFMMRQPEDALVAFPRPGPWNPQMCPVDDRTVGSVIQRRPCIGETLLSMGLRRGLSFYGKFLREIPGYAQRIALITAGRVSLSHCFPQEGLAFLAGQQDLGYFYETYMYKFRIQRFSSGGNIHTYVFICYAGSTAQSSSVFANNTVGPKRIA